MKRLFTCLTIMLLFSGVVFGSGLAYAAKKGGENGFGPGLIPSLLLEHAKTKGGEIGAGPGQLPSLPMEYTKSKGGENGCGPGLLPSLPPA